MSKRAREGDSLDNVSLLKRQRFNTPDWLSSLSDELILRVLSYLSAAELTVCHRISRKYEGLAADGQLWKSHYYNRFVRPRASRLPGLKYYGALDESLRFSSKASKWLDDDHLVKRGAQTNWKRQYKLRHNWSKGSCAVNEIEVADHAPIPPVIVQMHNGIIYIADQTEGLRAWSAQGQGTTLAHCSLVGTTTSHPTSIAIDAYSDTSDDSRIALGFEDGSFNIHSFSLSRGQFCLQYSRPASSNGVISAVAVSWPYVATMTATQLLSIYNFKTNKKANRGKPNTLSSPLLIHSLKSSTVWPPLSISLRLSEATLVISVAYSIPTYLSGWTVGIQEIWLDGSGEVLKSRLASAIAEHYRPLAFSSPPMLHHLAAPNAGYITASTTAELRHIHAKPTSLSYTHPYLLVSHPDNTLTLYLVTATSDSLTVSGGSRLWGHTSSVSGATVGKRGKAVSISRRGDELRVWELEGGFASSTARKRLASGDLSVQVKAEPRNVAQAGLDLVNHPGNSDRDDEPDEQSASDLILTRGWIGFDDENVVVLKEESHGRQALVVYDFT